MTPDSVLRSIPLCNGEFSYDENEPRRIKIWIRYDNIAPEDWDGKPSSNSIRTYPQWVYDFDNEERIDVDNNDDGKYENLDRFAISLDDETPAEDDEVTLEIEAIDSDEDTITDYEGNDAEITIEYRTSPTSSRYDATSTQVAIDDKTPEFEYGYAETDITFKYSYEYRITVTDNNENVDDYETFEVGDYEGIGYGDTDNFYLTTDDSTPTTSQDVDLTVKARDGTTTDTSYRGTVQFEVYYKASGSYTRVKTTSSTYYEMDADYEDDGYTFISSNNGTKIFSNLIQFKKNNYSYKVVVYDENDEDIEGYKIFTVGTVSNDSEVD